MVYAGFSGLLDCLPGLYTVLGSVVLAAIVDCYIITAPLHVSINMTYIRSILPLGILLLGVNKQADYQVWVYFSSLFLVGPIRSWARSFSVLCGIYCPEGALVFLILYSVFGICGA